MSESFDKQQPEKFKLTGDNNRTRVTLKLNKNQILAQLENNPL